MEERNDMSSFYLWSGHPMVVQTADRTSRGLETANRFPPVFHWQRGSTWEPVKTPPIMCSEHKHFLVFFLFWEWQVIYKIWKWLENSETHGGVCKELSHSSAQAGDGEGVGDKREFPAFATLSPSPQFATPHFCSFFLCGPTWCYNQDALLISLICGKEWDIACICSDMIPTLLLPLNKMKVLLSQFASFTFLCPEHNQWDKISCLCSRLLLFFLYFLLLFGT